MLDALARKLESLLDGSEERASAQDEEHAIRLAAAALLVEVARADFDFDAEEALALEELLRRHYELTEEEAALLREEASERVEHSVSLFEFTRTLHERLDEEQKSELMGRLWAVAFADGRLDKYEDAMVHKIGELLYVPRSEVMRRKLLARPDES
ncbi:tellurite resistance TerB family protein [Lentisalinibacter salinarum]|uniref:tellurite resistance TerB family protein n=1 Tax=Lentisalinibacter salinarum TaxID=2992239 RepID=UPI003870BE2D